MAPKAMIEVDGLDAIPAPQNAGGLGQLPRRHEPAEHLLTPESPSGHPPCPSSPRARLSYPAAIDGSSFSSPIQIRAELCECHAAPDQYVRLWPCNAPSLR